MRNISGMKLKAIMMCVVALMMLTTGLYVYRWANTKPKCNCLFPNSKRYGVVGQGGVCRVVDCEINRAGK